MPPRRFTQEQEKAIAADYERGDGGEVLAERWGCSSSLVYLIVTRNGGKLRPTTPKPLFTPEQDREIRGEYEQPRSAETIATERGVAPRTILGAVRRAGGRVRKPHETPRPKGMTPAERAERQRQRRAQRRNVGLCAKCPNPRLPSGSLCEPCAVKNRAHVRAHAPGLKERKRQAGICSKCPAPTLPGITLCEKHRESILAKARSISRDHRERLTFDRALTVMWRKARGLCRSCGETLTIPAVGATPSRCPQCLQRDKDRTNHTRAERAAAGLCIDCTTPGHFGQTRLCQSCWLCRVARTALRRDPAACKLPDRKAAARALAGDLLAAFGRQGGRCPYTGKQLSLGVNATLDHIAPCAAGGANAPGNLQWVYMGEDYDVNTMKSDISHGNFIRAIREMYQHLFGADQPREPSE